MTRAPFMTMLFRLTAFGRSSLPDHLDHERLPGRVVEQVHEPEQQSEQEDLPETDRPRHGQDREHECEHAGGGLRAVEDPPLVEAVRDQPAPRSEKQHRQELQARC